MQRDEDVRTSCMSALLVLDATFGRELPYVDGLDAGFVFRRRLLEDDDGPMLDLLKAFHERPIALPPQRKWHPDRERLAVRFDRFRERARD